MENITLIDPVNDPRWDTFVENHPWGWIVHLSGWKTVLENCFPHMKGHYLALVDSTSNEIRAGLPIFEVRSWLTGDRLITVPCATICDPLFVKKEDADRLLTAVLAISKTTGIHHIQIRTLNTHHLINNTFASDKLFVHHYLPLDKEPGEIKKSFHYKAVQYEINKAIKNKLQLKIADSESDLRCFYHLYSTTRKRLYLPAQPYQFFKSIWDVFSPSQNVMLLLALSNETVVAGHFLLLCNGRVSVEAVGWDATSKASPNHFLFWEGIKLSSSMGYKIFDFGRTSSRNESLISFKNRWGTTVVDLPHFFYPEQDSEKALQREISSGYKFIQMLCKRSPDFLYPSIGRFCFRHLG